MYFGPNIIKVPQKFMCAHLDQSCQKDVEEKKSFFFYNLKGSWLHNIYECSKTFKFVFLEGRKYELFKIFFLDQTIESVC